MITEAIVHFFTTPENLLFIFLGIVAIGSTIGVALGAFAFKVLSSHAKKERKMRKYVTDRHISIQKSLNNIAEQVHRNSKAVANGSIINKEATNLIHSCSVDLKAIDDKLTNNLMSIDSRFISLEITPEKIEKPVRKKRKYVRKASKKVAKRKVAKKKVSKK